MELKRLTLQESIAINNSRATQLAEQQDKIGNLIEQVNTLKRRLELATDVANHNHSEVIKRDVIIKKLKCTHIGREDQYCGAIEALGSSLDEQKKTLDAANELIRSQNNTIIFLHCAVQAVHQQVDPLPVQRRLRFEEIDPEETETEDEGDDNIPIIKEENTITL